MTLEKAHTIINNLLLERHFYPGTDDFNALSLGGHALIRLIKLRSLDITEAIPLLPSETPPEPTTK